eukprot:GHRQ01022686.1.p1 GENE.GHRQ01022686.1~~GHRQ01022686.1.p1  ORF type:complete len:163 (+),score=40.41 GHRQ01022686.1:330-818(+)
MALVTSGSRAYRTLQTRSLVAQARVRRTAVVAQAGPNGATAPAAAQQAKPKPVAAPAAKEFTNINRFIVPKHVQQAFIAAWRQREADMQAQPGFMGFNVISDGEAYTVSSRWVDGEMWAHAAGESSACSAAAGDTSSWHCCVQDPGTRTTCAAAHVRSYCRQ